MFGKTAAVLFGCALALTAFQDKPQTPPAEQPKPTGSIEGVVLDARAGTAVKDVSLLLAADNGAGAFSSAKSDESGHFSFKNLAPATYVLMGDHPRFARQTYGSRNGLLGGTLLTLAPGAAIKDLTFKLQPNGVISGKVVDADGEPVPKVMVAALKSMFMRNRREFLPLGTAVTNDLGEYRLGNLAPGRYLISAMPLPNDAASGGEALLPTYFPNSPDPAGAGPVDVAAGGDAGGMDVHILRAKAVTVKGKVVGDLSKQQSASVRLVPKGAGLLGAIAGRSGTIKKEDGTFEIKGATAGSYTLSATDATGMTPLAAPMAIDVGDKPIEGIVVQLGGIPEISGTVAVMGADQKPATGVQLKGVRVVLEAAEGMRQVPPFAFTGEDGTFTLKNVMPEKYLVRVVNGPENAYVDSIRLGVQSVPDDGIDFAGAGGTKLDIKLRLGGAQISGVVNGGDDKPISGVTVALVPNSGRYVLYSSSFTDQNGAFTFKNVTPGDYRVYAWEEVELNAWLDPEFVKPFAGRAEAVTVKDNDQKSVTLKAIAK